MKKLLSMLLVLVAMMAIFAVPANAAEIALVTDVGTIDDESFNQACWQGVEAFATANNLSYQYYQPAADSNDARMDSIVDAVDQGAKAIVLPGYLFGPSVAKAQGEYPEVKFIAVDVSAGDLGTDPLENLYCAVFGEEQAGYLAGYAVVKDGYTKLGFLGGIAVPAVQRYGYGFVQGANDAAVEAALAHKGWVIGVDVDQHYLGEAYVADYGYNPFVTSAMKELQNATEAALAKFYAGEWATIGGKIETLNLQAGNFVGLPMADESWGFKSFTKAQAEELAAQIAAGTVAVSDALEAPAVDANVTVNYID